MVEAPKLKQLLKVVEKRNPEWYNFVYGFVKGELEDLQLDNDDRYDNDIVSEGLDMNHFDGCVVGELFGFSNEYVHTGTTLCDTCKLLSMYLCNDSIDKIDRRSFVENLTKLYQHWGFMK